MESIRTRTQFAADAGHPSATHAFDTEGEYARVGMIRLLQLILFIHPQIFAQPFAGASGAGNRDLGNRDLGNSDLHNRQTGKDHDDPDYRIPPFGRDRRAG